MKNETKTLPQEEVEAPAEIRVVQPRVDVLENEKAIVLLADLPGTDESSVEITLENNVLTIRGKMAWSPPEGYEPRFTEFQPRTYERSFRLTKQVNVEGIEASVKNGLLRLRLPKAEGLRRIAVKTLEN